MGNSSLKQRGLRNNQSCRYSNKDFSPPWDLVERKMRIELNSYTERNDQFWLEMLTHIGEVYILNNYWSVVTLYR